MKDMDARLGTGCEDGPGAVAAIGADPDVDAVRAAVEALRKVAARLALSDGMQDASKAVGSVATDVSRAADALWERLRMAGAEAESWRKVAESYQTQCLMLRLRPVLDDFARAVQERHLGLRDGSFNDLVEETASALLDELEAMGVTGCGN